MYLGATISMYKILTYFVRVKFLASQFDVVQGLRKRKLLFVNCLFVSNKSEEITSEITKTQIYDIL